MLTTLTPPPPRGFASPECGRGLIGLGPPFFSLSFQVVPVEHTLSMGMTAGLVWFFSFPPTGEVADWGK